VKGRHRSTSPDSGDSTARESGVLKRVSPNRKRDPIMLKET